MAPIKFEEKIKDKLDKRIIQPSDSAWDKLSERLGDQGKKKPNKPIFWLGLAASIVGILLVIPQFFNDETSVEDIPEIVVIPEPVEQNDNNAKEIETHTNIVNTSENIQSDEKEVIKKSIKKPELIKPEFNKEQPVIAQENNTEKLDEVPVVNPDEVILEPLSFEQQKIQTVANKIQALKDNNTVTNEAIDALLLEAQKEIRLHRLYNEATGVVDADLLLQEVESDLDQSFRSKVFEAIKASYGTVKTAIAKRND